MRESAVLSVAILYMYVESFVCCLINVVKKSAIGLVLWWGTISKCVLWLRYFSIVVVN